MSTCLPLSYEYLGERALHWQIGSSTFDLLPERGARLMRWCHAGRDIIHWPSAAPDGNPINSPATADAIHGTYGGNPILFPFPGRCYNNGEMYHWRTPDGRHLPMPLHGIANRGTFTERKQCSADGSHGFSARFVPDDNAIQCYPFNYEFTVSYSFTETQLTCDLILKNHSQTEELPWNPGHHFYFALPLEDGLRRNDHFVRIDSTQIALARSYPTGILQPAPAFAPIVPLDNELLSMATSHYGLRSNRAELFCNKPDSTRIVILHGDEPLPPPAHTFVTWSLPDAPFYCIEPYGGPPNTPAHGIGLHRVPPGQTQRFRVRVLLQTPSHF